MEIKCNHERKTTGPHMGFTGSVAEPPYTSADPIAHGGVTYTQTCTDCGAVRRVNANAGHYEVSAWSAQQRLSGRELKRRGAYGF